VGTARPATPDEHEAVVELRFAFEREALGGVDDPEATRQATTLRLAEQSNTFGMWVLEVDGELVALSGHGGPTPNGIRIGPVYTLPEHRGRGYASALVAAQSQWLLDSGRRFCFLYTDLANPTSNSVYRRIGYRQIGESAEYSFSEA
jgi:predicted GNAT family acetyltransferase